MNTIEQTMIDTRADLARLVVLARTDGAAAEALAERIADRMRAGLIEAAHGAPAATGQDGQCEPAGGVPGAPLRIARAQW